LTVIKLLESIFNIKIIKRHNFDLLKQSVDNVAKIYKVKAGDSYHNWDSKAEFKLTDISDICVAENILSD